MKKTAFFLFLPLILVASFTLAQENESSPTLSPKTTVLPTKGPTDKIQELKDRVASRVAALKKEKLGGLTGTVKSTSDGALILIVQNTEYSVQLDEDGIVYSIDTGLKKKEIKLSDIEKNQNATVIGTINKEEKSVAGSAVIVKEPNIALTGKVKSVSTKDGTITITSLDDKIYTVDIEVATKNIIYDPNKDVFNKIGLSKIDQEAKIHVYGTKGKEENSVSASRVLIIPDVTSATAAPSPTNQITPKLSPKLTPKLTPTPTKAG